jgi:hypothetical protein
MVGLMAAVPCPIQNEVIDKYFRADIMKLGVLY